MIFLVNYFFCCWFLFLPKIWYDFDISPSSPFPNNPLIQQSAHVSGYGKPLIDDVTVRFLVLVKKQKKQNNNNSNK